MHMPKNKKLHILEYFILFMLIAQAGFPFFVGNTYLIIFFSLTLLLFAVKGYKINNFIIKYILAFLFLMVAQIITTGNFLFGPFIGIILRIFYAFVAIKLIGTDFKRYYVNLMYFFTITSMIFWFLLAFVPDVYDLFANFSQHYIEPLQLYPLPTRQNIIIYTNDYWMLDQFPRNAGPFWEPGAFGVFLNIAILFNTLNKGTLVNKKNIIFFIALITTFSLGSYAAFFIFIFSYIFFVKKIFSLKSILAFLILIYAGIYSYNNFDFLGGKFEKKYQAMEKFDTGFKYDELYFKVGRNEQAILDINSFIRHPLFGEGQFVKYDFGESASGLTVILRKWGIIGFFLIFTIMYKSFQRFVIINNLHKGFIIVAVLTLMAVALTQSLFGKPIFIGIIFIYFLFDKYNIKHNKLVKIETKIHGEQTTSKASTT